MRAYLFFLAQVVFACTALAQPLANTPAPLKLVNTPYDELNAVMSPDGRSLYITVANHPQNVGGRRDPGDIWISTLDDNDQWSQPVHGGAALNDRAYNGVAGFSADGQDMYLLSHYDRANGVARTQGISVSHRAGSGWSTPENISIPYFVNKSGQLSGALSVDGSIFVFSAETYGTRGVEDLYVSVKTGGRWSEPRNLGGIINTPFQELSPFLAADGKTLYFSSNGRKGSGSFDIYRAIRQDDSWSNWSTPENLGPAVNTSGRELYYRMYVQQGFSTYSSTTNSDGYGDVKQYRPDDMPPADTVAAPVIAQVSIRMDTVVNTAAPATNDNMVHVYGKVMNSRTGEGVGAFVTFSGMAGTTPVASVPLNSKADIGYTLRIPSTGQYIVKVEASGFISNLEKLDVKTYEMKDLELNFRLQPIEVGTTVSLRNVLFEQSKTELLPESYEELNLVVAFLRNNERVRIELSGHTDNRGIPVQNVKLSQARVDKVKDYLVSKGIAAKRIEGKGYGGSKPIASNDSEETRQLNRRVEFTIKRS